MLNSNEKSYNLQLNFFFYICYNVLLFHLAIATAAMEMLGGKDSVKSCRKPDIMADAAYAIFLGRSSGNFYIDELLLKEQGVKDFDQYAVDPCKC